MSNYIIITDSASDLPAEYAINHNIVVLPLKFHFGEETYNNYLDFREMSQEVFYQRLRDGEFPQTSQVNVDQYKNAYVDILQQDKDILVITLSQELSGTYNSAVMAKEEVLKDYPGRKILIVNSKSGSLGQGMVVNEAVKLKEAKVELDEAFNKLEDYVYHVGHAFTMADLIYLKKGGRIGSVVYHLGSKLNIKPIISADNDGKLKLRTQAFGRKKSLNSIIKRVVSSFDSKYGNQIYISHGDALEEALYVKEGILSSIEAEIGIINIMGPVIGTHGGPGTIAVFYPAKER